MSLLLHLTFGHGYVIPPEYDDDEMRRLHDSRFPRCEYAKEV